MTKRTLQEVQANHKALYDALPKAKAVAYVDPSDYPNPHAPCMRCGEEHPINVLDDDLCPACGDEDGGEEEEW